MKISEFGMILATVVSLVGVAMVIVIFGGMTLIIFGGSAIVYLQQGRILSSFGAFLVFCMALSPIIMMVGWVIEEFQPSTEKRT